MITRLTTVLPLTYEGIIFVLRVGEKQLIELNFNFYIKFMTKTTNTRETAGAIGASCAPVTLHLSVKVARKFVSAAGHAADVKTFCAADMEQTVARPELIAPPH